jgi:hypothetical protein
VLTQTQVLGTLRELDEREGEKLGKLVEEEEEEEGEEEEEAAAEEEEEVDDDEDDDEDEVEVEVEEEEEGGVGAEEAAGLSRFVLSMHAAAADRVALRYQTRAEAAEAEAAEAAAEAEGVGGVACSLADLGLGTEEEKGVALRRAAAGQRAAGLGQGLGQLSTRRLRPAAANAQHEAAPLAPEDMAARAVKPRKKAPARARVRLGLLTLTLTRTLTPI